jgi:enoyl-CoA hydratase/carnithine racemase
MGVEVRATIDGDERVARLLRLHRLTVLAATSWRTSGGSARTLGQIERVSEELREAGLALGSEHRLSRRLLSLRESLDSHLLTAAAIRGDDDREPASPAVHAMVQRGIDIVLNGLPRAGDHGTHRRG